MGDVHRFSNLEAPKKTSQRPLFLRKKLCFTPKTAKKPLKTPPAVDYRGIFDQKKYAVKEPDHETGLYYYGARYLDPKTSRWISGDPALGEYLPVAPLGDEEKKRNQNLPGQGGVFNYVNLHVYHYAGNNPVRYVDPDGESDVDQSVSFETRTGKVQEGIFKADGSVSVGYAESMVRLQVNAKDTTVAKGMVGVYGKASAVNVTGKAGVGTDDVAVSVKGVGDLVTATAQAGIGIRDGGGGLVLEGRASVASGRATLEFNLFGCEIEVGVSGHALSVSGSLVAGIFPKEGFKLKIGASLGLGADLLLRVKPR